MMQVVQPEVTIELTGRVLSGTICARAEDVIAPLKGRLKRSATIILPVTLMRSLSLLIGLSSQQNL
jgi:hypothetical protein